MIIANLFKNRSTTLLVIMCLYVFFLPFRNNISSVLGIILFLFFFIDKQVNVRTKLNEIKSSTIALLSISLYLIHIIGLLYTENFKYAGLDLEIKLPLLIIPMFIFSERGLNKKNTEKIFFFFTIGNILSIIYCLVYACIKSLKTNTISVFFYNELSQFMHPSYMSMYLVFNTLIITYRIIKNTNSENYHSKKIIILFIINTLFLVFIALLSSKSGIIFLGIWLFILTIREILRKKYYLLIYMLILFSLLSVTLLSIKDNPTTRRFKEARNEIQNYNNKSQNEKTGSSDTRIEVWKASVQILINNPFIGVGTGDIKDELLIQYQKNKYLTGVQNQFNCHNQFLQFVLIFGIIGGTLFIVIISITFKKAMITNNTVLILFLLIISFNMLLESILESKAGVEFYAFFLPFLVKNNYKIEN